MSERALSVDAELVVERGGRTFRVWSEDDRVVVDAPSLAALRSLASLRDVLAAGAVPVGDPALDPDGALADAGITVEVQVRRAPVARVGAGVTGDPLGRRLTGVDAAVDPRGVLVAGVRALG